MSEFKAIVRNQLLGYILSTIVAITLYVLVLILSTRTATISVVIGVGVILGYILLLRLIPSIKHILLFIKVRHLLNKDEQQCLAFIVGQVEQYKEALKVIQKRQNLSSYESVGSEFQLLRSSGYNIQQTRKMYELFTLLGNLLQTTLNEDELEES